jgi:transcriptional regulator with XRE-family HTH domain
MLMATRASDFVVPYLRGWRADQGLTQKELAAKADVSHNTVLRAEAGSPVNVRTLAKLAKALGISVHDLRHVDPDQRA